MKTLNNISFLLAGLMMTSACTQNYDTNPLKEYPLLADRKQVNSPDDLKKHETPVREVIVVKEVEKEVIKYVPKEVEKNFVAAQLFQIQNLDSVSFVTGTQSQVRFEVRVLQGSAQFTTSAEGLPTGATLKEISADQNKKVYALSFKPASNLLKNGNQEETRNFKLRLNVQSLVHEDKEKEAKIKEALAVVDKSKSFEMTIRPNRSNPKIEKIDMPEVVSEGDKQAMSISVEVPGTYEGSQPRMFVTYDFKGFNGQIFENNGSGFIRPSTSRKPVEFVSEGKWIFNFDIDTQSGAVIPPQLNNQLKVIDSDTVALRANIIVLSPTGATSDEKTIKFKIAVKRSAVVPTGTTGTDQ